MYWWCSLPRYLRYLRKAVIILLCALQLHTTINGRQNVLGGEARPNWIQRLERLHGLNHLLGCVLKLSVFWIVYLVKVLLHHNWLIMRLPIEVNSLVWCEIGYRLLHVVVIDYLRLALVLIELIKGAHSMLKLLIHRKVRHLLPTCLFLHKHLLLGPSLSSAFFLWYLLSFFRIVVCYVKLGLLLSRLLQASPSSCYGDNIIFTY